MHTLFTNGDRLISPNLHAIIWSLCPRCCAPQTCMTFCGLWMIQKISTYCNFCVLIKVPFPLILQQLFLVCDVQLDLCDFWRSFSYNFLIVKNPDDTKKSKVGCLLWFILQSPIYHLCVRVLTHSINFKNH